MTVSVVFDYLRPSQPFFTAIWQCREMTKTLVKNFAERQLYERSNLEKQKPSDEEIPITSLSSIQINMLESASGSMTSIKKRLCFCAHPSKPRNIFFFLEENSFSNESYHKITVNNR